MNRAIHVETGESGYDIHIEDGLLRRAGELLREYSGKRCAVVTDDNVGPLYGEVLLEQLHLAGVEPITIQVPSGENSKSFEQLQKLYSGFFAHKLTRSDFVVALGGGVVGDLAGFAASTYLRGIDIIQVPTSLLAQVDSSVGGKAAVNIDEGKNLVGAFFQPSVVLIDTETLNTLDARQIHSGMAEIIKHGAIADENLFAALERGEINYADIVRRNCEIKAGYVQKDPNEHGVRIQLNFGHTLAHALEKTMGYGTLLHGEAVAIGMAAAAHWGEMLGVTPAGVAERIEALLEKNGLPIRAKLDAAEVTEVMLGDKKAAQGGVRAVLLTRIGEACVMRLDGAAILELTEALQWK